MAELACHGKFIAPNTPQDVGLAAGGLEEFPGLGEACGAHAVAMKIVDLFQVIQVNEEDRERYPRPLRQAQGLLAKQMKPSQVIEAGQLVPHGEVVNLVFHAFDVEDEKHQKDKRH